MGRINVRKAIKGELSALVKKQKFDARKERRDEGRGETIFSSYLCDTVLGSFYILEFFEESNGK